jgi:hypothetical protein
MHLISGSSTKTNAEMSILFSSMAFQQTPEPQLRRWKLRQRLTNRVLPPPRRKTKMGIGMSGFPTKKGANTWSFFKFRLPSPRSPPPRQHLRSRSMATFRHRKRAASTNLTRNIKELRSGGCYLEWCGGWIRPVGEANRG